MPELPEVETVRRGLEPVLAGARLARVEARRPDLRFPLPDGFVQRLTGARIERLERRAKYLLAPLDRDETLVMHLGMSGRFEIAAPETHSETRSGTRAEAPARPGGFALAQPPDPKHAHIVFVTEAGAMVTFYDPRRFGYMDLIATDALAEHPWFKGLGPEPMGCEFDAAYLASAAAGRKAPIKNLLLDQRVIAGLGNIYVCEALHRAGIAPERAAGSGAAAQAESAGGDDPRGARRGDRSRRIDLARLRRRGRFARLLPAPLHGLWPRGRAVPEGGLPRPHRADRPGRPFHLRLQPVPDVRAPAGGVISRLGALVVAAALALGWTPAHAKPPVWIVRSHGATLLLFGSIHLLPAGLDWRPAALDDALASADEVWFELPITAKASEEAGAVSLARGALPKDKRLIATC